MKFSSLPYILTAIVEINDTVFAAQPNIIVMQPDDLQYYDEWSPPPNNPSRANEVLATPSVGLPNMEFLKNGLHMLQAYTVSPMCGTSRYSTM